MIELIFDLCTGRLKRLFPFQCKRISVHEDNPKS